MAVVERRGPLPESPTNVSSKRTVRQTVGASQHPLHIMYLTGQGGGAETYVRQMARTLVALGQKVSILFICSPGQNNAGPSRDGSVLLDYIVMPNLHYYYGRVAGLLPFSAGQVLPSATTVKVAEASLAVRRALHSIAQRRGAIDVIELPEETAYPILFHGLAPYAVKLHSSDATWRHFCGEGLRPDDLQRIRLEARLLRRARLVTAPSAAVADHIARVCSYPRARITVLPYPLDTELFNPSSPADIMHSSEPERDDTEPPSVLYVGRMDHRKGLETLARAAHAILTAVPTATIDIVGSDTPEVNAPRLLAHIPPSLHDRVVFHGRVPHADLPGYYQRAAVCVVPSRWDNSPNTVYEAMGCGTPVVASRVGGIPELVIEGKTGLLVPPDDPTALTTAVCILLADPGRRMVMGHAARERATAQFDPTKIATQTLEMYRAAVDRPSGKDRIAH